MAFDTGLAERIRQNFDVSIQIDEKKMFGGIGFLLNGNMVCGVYKDQLIARVGPERYSQLLDKPNTSAFDITGRAMKGWLMVSADGYESDHDLDEWINISLNFARTLPAK